MFNENLFNSLLMEAKWLNYCLNHKVFIPDVQGEAFLAIYSLLLSSQEGILCQIKSSGGLRLT
jgi:hypothetical protein